jgi:hypothetical protein
VTGVVGDEHLAAFTKRLCGRHQPQTAESTEKAVNSVGMPVANDRYPGTVVDR